MDSKSPDRYTINKNLVVNLNDSLVKPVHRENSNTTEVTRVTGITVSTGITNGFNGSSGQNKTISNTFYSTENQIKGSKNYN